MTEQDAIRFAEACRAVAAEAAVRQGIGTLQEKTLHRVCKRYAEPVAALHEQKIGAFTADACNENGILEIQTGSFYPMQKKLRAFLSVTNVEIIHPLFREKQLVWIDPENGELSAPRRSPRKQTVYDCATDFYWIREFLGDPHLTVRLLFLSATEYRLKDGWGRDGKRGSHRDEWEPHALLDDMVLCGRDAYAALLPFGGEPFTTGELAKKIGRPRELTRYFLQTLQYLSVIRECGRRSREKLYCRIP